MGHVSGSQACGQHVWKNDSWVPQRNLGNYNAAIVERQPPGQGSGVFYHGSCAGCGQEVIRELNKDDPILWD